MIDVKELNRRLDQFQTGNLRDKEMLIESVISRVHQFVSELKEEIELARQAERAATELKRITQEHKSKTDLSQQDRLEEQNAQDLFDRATRAKRDIDEKKRALRTLSQKVDQLRGELREFN